MTPRDLDALELQVAECHERGMLGTILDLTRLEALLRTARDHARLLERLEAANAPKIYDASASSIRGLCVDVRGERCCLFATDIPACARCGASPPRKAS